jgi:uncharacterized membrane protein
LNQYKKNIFKILNEKFKEYELFVFYKKLNLKEYFKLLQIKYVINDDYLFSIKKFKIIKLKNKNIKDYVGSFDVKLNNVYFIDDYFNNIKEVSRIDKVLVYNFSAFKGEIENGKDVLSG